MKFTKMHGTGNDFILLDGRDSRLRGIDLKALSRAMCDRHYGIGSDGLILVEESSVAPFRMRMFNPDGSESEMCGNGIRCFGKYVFDRGLVRESRQVVETGAGVLTLDLTIEGGETVRVRVDMGRPRFRPAEIPIAVAGEAAVDVAVDGVGAAVRVDAVSMGNPHAVMFLDTPVAEFPLAEIGPRVERHPLFPRRVNFEIARMLESDCIEARVWERGVGLTLACGTGACAIMAAVARRGLVGRHARVRLPGGELLLEWDGVGSIFLTGPATQVFEGVWPHAA